MTSEKEQETAVVDVVATEESVETHHVMTINGRSLGYTAVAGTMLLREEDESGAAASKAKVFFVAYLLDDQSDPAERPLTFCFNGGPGSSSVWLHLGLLGPRRVDLGQEGQLPPPPYKLLDNEYSLLDKTDLVFIDPVTTGYSRPAEGEDAKQFHEFTKDLQSIAEFIRLFTTRRRRWLSPKFLIGESYGTTRSAGLAGLLDEAHGLTLNGIMLISSVLNFQTLHVAPGNDLPYALFLPTFTAAAWYHGRLAADLQENLHEALAEAEAFAAGEYQLALMQGASLTPQKKAEIVSKLARLTGLSEEYVERTNLRINIFRFIKELLRDQRRTIGRLDSRLKGIDRDAAGEENEFDPSMVAIRGPYTAALNDYMRRQLRFESDLPYEILTGRVHPWRFEAHQNEFVDVGETLRKALSLNPYLKVFVANGYYDLATPYFGTRYTFDHLGLDESLQENVRMGFYEAGHMMYIHVPSLVQLKQDLADFIDYALPGVA
jgi:carboxypeptidase C (cathepsin A)